MVFPLPSHFCSHRRPRGVGGSFAAGFRQKQKSGVEPIVQHRPPERNPKRNTIPIFDGVVLEKKNLHRYNGRYGAGRKPVALRAASTLHRSAAGGNLRYPAAISISMPNFNRLRIEKQGGSVDCAPIKRTVLRSIFQLSISMRHNSQLDGIGRCFWGPPASGRRTPIGLFSPCTCRL